jgi:hypothetical protein
MVKISELEWKTHAVVEEAARVADDASVADASPVEEA